MEEGWEQGRFCGNLQSFFILPQIGNSSTIFKWEDPGNSCFRSAQVETFMSLEKSDVENIAHLARLNIEESAVAGYAKDLSGILDLVEEMNAIDTTGVEPLAHPHDAVQRLREDTVSEENQREALQAHAPQTENGLFLVPKVIE